MQDTYINYLKVIDSNLKRNSIDLELDFENRLDESIEILNLFLYYNRIMLSTDSEYGVSSVLPFEQSSSAEAYIKNKLFEEYSDDWQKELNQLLEQPANAGKLELDENLAKQFLNFLNLSTEEESKPSMQDIIKMTSVEYDEEPEYDTDEEDEYDYDSDEEDYDPYEDTSTGVLNNSEQEYEEFEEDDYDPYEDDEMNPEDSETIEQDNVSSLDAGKVGNSFESPYVDYDEYEEFDEDEADSYDTAEDMYDEYDEDETDEADESEYEEDEYDSDDEADGEDESDDFEDEADDFEDESDEYDSDEELDEADEFESEDEEDFDDSDEYEDEADDFEDESDEDLEDESDEDEIDEFELEDDEEDESDEEDDEDLFDDFDYDEEDNYDVPEDKLAQAQASVFGTNSVPGVIPAPITPAAPKPVAAIQTADAFVDKVNKWLSKFR